MNTATITSKPSLSETNIPLVQDHMPIYLFRPKVLKKNAKLFLEHFPGTVAYAVKANVEVDVIQTLLKTGIDSFDVASIKEIRLIRSLSKNAKLLYMNTIKPENSIKEAYTTHGVKAFSLDAGWELEKIIRATNAAHDLELFVRLTVDNQDSKVKLTEKFGIDSNEAPALLNQVKKIACKVGVCFHVGSQCMNKMSFIKALMKISSLMKSLPFKINYLNIGGGFPAPYKFNTNFVDFLTEIKPILLNKNFSNIEDIICEPGRSLVANAESLLVCVLGRKGNHLYINDGLFGGIFEPSLDFPFPVRLLRKSSAPQKTFYFYGPTCDSTDKINAAFLLPGDVHIDDFIEIGHMGAYSKVFRSDFNGFMESRRIYSNSAAF